jgi:hypothetical protein
MIGLRSFTGTAACGVLLALMGSNPAAAQDAAPPTRVESASAASPSEDLRRGFRSAIQVAGSTDKTDASLTFSWSDQDDTEATETTLGSNRTDTWSLVVSTPLGDDEESADFVTDAGLPGVGSVTASFTRLSTKGVPAERASSTEMHAIFDRAAVECLRVRRDPEFCNDPENRRSIIMRPYMTEPDRSIMFPDLSHVWTTRFSLSGTVGAKTYRFRDALTLAKDSVSETPYSFSVEYGGAPQPGAHWWTGWYRGVGYTFSEGYDVADSQTLCAPPPPSGPVECFTGPFSAPALERKSSVFGVARRHGFNEAIDLPWGAEIKIAYDFEAERAGLEGTLFVIPGDGGLRGGVRFKVQEDDQDPLTEDDRGSIGIFVGSAF